LFVGHRGGSGGGWSGRGSGGGGDRPYSGGYQQQQQYDPYMQSYSEMNYQGQQQIVNEYAGMDYSGRGRGGRGGRGSRRPY
jgi:hypothetical protein